MELRTALAFFVFAFVLVARSTGAGAAATVPLDYRAYDSYNIIKSTTISDDGRYAAYVLAPEDGDPTLVIHDFTNGHDVREPRGTSPIFTADSKYAIFTLRAPNDELRKAKRDHKKPKELPPNGLGIVDLSTGSATIVDLVKSVAVPHDPGSDTIAYLRATPMPSTSPTGTGTAAASASPAPGATRAVRQPSVVATIPPAIATATASPAGSPAASASPDDLHKTIDGTDLVIRDIANARETSVPHVITYAVSHDGAFVAYATQTKSGKDDAVFLRSSTSTDVPKPLMHGAGHFDALTFAPKSERFAFASDADTFAATAPQYEIFSVDASSVPETALVPVLRSGTPGIPANWAPSVAATPAFSKDAQYLYVGTAPAPTPVPSGTPEPTAVDIWNYRDVDLQTVQRVNADDERTRTYLAAIALENGRVAQLGTPDVRDVTQTLEAGATYALGSNDTPYRRAASWRADRQDLYAIALADGTRHRIVTELRDQPQFAPTGRFVVTYEAAKRAWYSTRLSDGKRVDLTSALHVPFYDELDDHPDFPPPYEFAGWLDGDRAALVRDRYDIWAVDPATGHAYSLTGQLGRRGHVRFSLHQLDADATSFASSAPILAEALDDRTKDRELWTIQTNPATRSSSLRMFARVPMALSWYLRARDGSRFVVGERAFTKPENLFAGDTVGGALTPFSDANPQMAGYRGGTERLIYYRSKTGIPLRGILLEPTPDGSHAKRPMLVYFYERFSDDLHTMYLTTPGPATGPNLLRYVSHGYVVFVPDIAYRVGHPGESAYDCIMPGVDAAIHAGNVDPKRIGISGHSWAAYQIAYLLTRTDRFRAAEAGAAVANMTSAYGGIRLESGLVREFQYEVDQSRIGATPWDRPDLYLENSPLFHIKNVHTPYLSIANDHDGAVPWQQGIEFATALRQLDKEAYMFQFDGEDHNLKDRENQKYWTVHLDEFFDHFLMGAPEPVWMRDGVDFLHRGQRDVRPLFGESL